MTPARRRVGQFFRYLKNSPLAPAEWDEVGLVLAPPLRALFERMTPGEQKHSLAVLRAVRAGGTELPAGVFQAALLHDVGKTRAPIGLLGRVFVVLAGKLLPAQRRRWGKGAPLGWRRPFVTAARHAEWGAELCAQAGADPLAVNLIRRHQDPAPSGETDEDQWLRLLQRADDDH